MKFYHTTITLLCFIHDQKNLVELIFYKYRMLGLFYKTLFTFKNIYNPVDGTFLENLIKASMHAFSLDHGLECIKFQHVCTEINFQNLILKANYLIKFFIT